MNELTKKECDALRKKVIEYCNKSEELHYHETPNSVVVFKGRLPSRWPFSPGTMAEHRNPIDDSTGAQAFSDVFMALQAPLIVVHIKPGSEPEVHHPQRRLADHADIIAHTIARELGRLRKVEAPTHLKFLPLKRAYEFRATIVPRGR